MVTDKFDLANELIGKWIQVPSGQWVLVEEFEGINGKYAGFRTTMGPVVNFTFEEYGKLKWYYEHSKDEK